MINKSELSPTRPLVNKILVTLLLGIGVSFGAIWILKLNVMTSHQLAVVPDVTQNPPSVEVLTSRLQDVVDSTTSVLQSIRDETTALDTISSIDESTAQVISLRLDRLPESHRSTLMVTVKPMVDQIVKVLKEIYKIPGVQAFIEPAISPMLSRLQAFANVSAD